MRVMGTVEMVQAEPPPSPHEGDRGEQKGAGEREGG